MKKEQNNLDQLKKDNPFKVPEGYMEGLTQQIMSQLPEKKIPETKQVTMMDRVRPWLYMAAMFAGLGLFFKVFIGTDQLGNGNRDDSLLVQSGYGYEELYMDEEDYLDFIEHQYTDVLLTEEFRYLD